MATTTKTRTKTRTKAPVKKARAKTVEVSKKTTRKVVKVVESPETEGIFYKVLETTFVKEKEVLVSPSIMGRLRTFYYLGRKTKANEEMLKEGYGILIFSSIAKAYRWGGSTRIYEVKVGKVLECPARRLHRNVLRYLEREKPIFNNPRTSWKSLVKKMMQKLDVVDSWPTGSKMVDWIIPVRRLSSEEVYKLELEEQSKK